MPCFSPTGDRFNKNHNFGKSLFFIENSIQNHARKVDVRSIEKSLKNDAKMEPKSFQNR